MTIRFSEADVRSMGRATAGVRGMKLKNAEDAVVSCDVARDDAVMLFVSSSGHGKRTKLDAFNRQGRGGQGVRGMKITASRGRWSPRSPWRPPTRYSCSPPPAISSVWAPRRSPPRAGTPPGCGSPASATGRPWSPWHPCSKPRTATGSRPRPEPVEATGRRGGPIRRHGQGRGGVGRRPARREARAATSVPLPAAPTEDAPPANGSRTASRERISLLQGTQACAEAPTELRAAATARRSGASTSGQCSRSRSASTSLRWP